MTKNATQMVLYPRSPNSLRYYQYTLAREKIYLAFNAESHVNPVPYFHVLEHPPHGFAVGQHRTVCISRSPIANEFPSLAPPPPEQAQRQSGSSHAGCWVGKLPQFLLKVHTQHDRGMRGNLTVNEEMMRQAVMEDIGAYLTLGRTGLIGIYQLVHEDGYKKSGRLEMETIECLNPQRISKSQQFHRLSACKSESGPFPRAQLCRVEQTPSLRKSDPMRVRPPLCQMTGLVHFSRRGKAFCLVVSHIKYATPPQGNHTCIRNDDWLSTSPKEPLLACFDIIHVPNAYSSSSSSSFLIGTARSICPPPLPVKVSDKPNPKRCRIASSSKPETLALARFKGLPTVPLSKALEDPRSNLAFGSSVGGVVASFDACGGVEPAVGVVDAGDLRVAGVLEFRGSAECWRFS